MDKEQETKLSLLMRAMIKYDGGDVPRIQHFVKVHDFARMIGVAEDMGSEILGKSAYHYGETHINKVEELLKGSGIEVRIRNYQ